MLVKLKLFLCLAMAVGLASFAHAQDTQENLKGKLEERYKGQKVNVVPPGVIVGFAKITGELVLSGNDFSVHYDHFFDGVDIPKGYQKRDKFDERTTQEVDATGAVYSSTTEPGETLEVVKLNFLRRGKEYLLDLLLKAISARHLSVRGRQAQGATILSKNDIGVSFRFILPADVVEHGKYDEVVERINRYFMPEREYVEIQSKSAAAASAPKTVELGQTVDQVQAVLGKPETIINLGTKVTFVYKNLKVVFADGKVVDVQ